MSQSKTRKANKVESFNPTPQNKIIIDAIVEKMPKAHFYNLLIEKYGELEAQKILSFEQFDKMLKELELLKV